MKKLLTAFTLFIIISLSAQAGGPKFQKKMGETLGKFATAQSQEQMQALANEFQMIARVEKKEWLPLYYHAQLHIIMSFRSEGDADAKDALLDVAEESINKMIELAPREAEVYALQGFLYTARLVVDPATRGQQYSMLSQQSIGRALGMEPANPRARYFKLSNDIGTANYFGRETAPLCAKAKSLLAEWDNYAPASRIHPAWGKAQVEELATSCK